MSSQSEPDMTQDTQAPPRGSALPPASPSPGIRWFPPVTVRGRRYERATARTPWLQPGDDMGAAMATALAPILQPGDVALVSEKALVISAGLGVPVDRIAVSPLARWLAGRVRPTEGSKGLSIPEKMEYVLRESGRVRLLAAVAVAGLTRPLGLRGGFYLVAGRVARAMDGLRPPFEHLLLASLSPRVATAMALRLSARLGNPVAVIDMNDRGGSIRAVSHPVISKRRLRRALADNPLGQRDTRTPIGLIRPVR